jgi:hypothetical protein
MSIAGERTMLFDVFEHPLKADRGEHPRLTGELLGLANTRAYPLSTGHSSEID